MHVTRPCHAMSTATCTAAGCLAAAAAAGRQGTTTTADSGSTTPPLEPAGRRALPRTSACTCWYTGCRMCMRGIKFCGGRRRPVRAVRQVGEASRRAVAGPAGAAVPGVEGGRDAGRLVVRASTPHAPPGCPKGTHREGHRHGLAFVQHERQVEAHGCGADRLQTKPGGGGGGGCLQLHVEMRALLRGSSGVFKGCGGGAAVVTGVL